MRLGTSRASPKTNQAIVDSRFLSDLNVVGINDFYKTKTHIVGQINNKMNLEPFQVVKQLIEADVLQTYFHIESKLTLETLQEKPDFIARIKGSHVYFTNDRNEDFFTFKVRIDKAGVITAFSD